MKNRHHKSLKEIADALRAEAEMTERLRRELDDADLWLKITLKVMNDDDYERAIAWFDAELLMRD